MRNRTHFYVSHKSVLAWLMALCMVCSVVARILLPGVKGAGYSTPDLWSQMILPIAAALLYALIVLCSGREQFYKTAIPVWMMAIYYCFYFSSYSSNPLNQAMYAIAMLFMAVMYNQISAGKKMYLLLLPVNLIPACMQLYRYKPELIARDWMACLPIVADLLMSLGLVLTVFAIKVHPADEYHPTWGDRPDGRRIRTLAPMAQITAFFQVERNTCSNLFEESIEISQIERYIRQKRKEGYADFGLLHVLLAAYVRGLCKYPQLNRFVSGQKVYSRGEDIQYCMVVKKEMTIDAPDTTIKVHLRRTDTAVDVYNKINAAIEGVKKSQELDSGVDHAIAYLNLIPSVVLKFVIWLLKLLDYFGLLPKFLLELSPFHGSLFFTSMGSLGIRPIYHHLYDFGNLPAFGAFGCKRRAIEVQEDGSIVQKKYLDMKFVLDERIVDGYYYAAFFKHYRAILRRPEQMDSPPEEILPDID